MSFSLAPLSVSDAQGFLVRNEDFSLRIDGVWGPKTQASFDAFMAKLPALPSADASSFIATQEGFDVPADWPGGASGVTIGIGYDLGYSTRERVNEDWSPYLSSPDVERLQNAVGFKGQEARAIVPKVRDIPITKSMALEEFRLSELPSVRLMTLMAWPAAIDLLADAQAALMSLIYNRGTATRGPTRGGMSALIHLSQSADYFTMAQTLYEMIALWQPGGALYQGPSISAALRDRRHAEGDLLLIAGLRASLNQHVKML